MSRTRIGDVRLRTDLTAHAKTVDGKERVFLNLVPNKEFGHLRAFGSYRFWRVPFCEGSERLIHEWRYFDSMRTDTWQPVEPRDGNICFPGMLQWGIEAIAHELECDVWMTFRTEYQDPGQLSDTATIVVIHLFGLDKVRNLNNFVQAIASKINREAKRWMRESATWDLESECV